MLSAAPHGLCEGSWPTLYDAVHAEFHADPYLPPTGHPILVAPRYAIDASLSLHARRELQYVLQVRREEATAKVMLYCWSNLVALRTQHPEGLFTDVPATEWIARLPTVNGQVRSFIRAAHRILSDFYSGVTHDVEREFDGDHWRVTILDPHNPIHSGRNINFTGISQPWLKATAKTWARWRITTKAFGTVMGDIHSLTTFSTFLEQQNVQHWSEVDRDRLDQYVRWLAATGHAGRADRCLVVLRLLLDTARVRGWASGLPPDAMIFREDVARFYVRKSDRPSRWLPPSQIAQLRSPSNLALLANAEVRRFLQIIMASGLRSGDCRTLPIGCLREDSTGAPMLVYRNNKMKREAARPIDTDTAGLLRAQHAHALDQNPQTRWLWTSNHHKKKYPYSKSYFDRHFKCWLRLINIVDDQGQPIDVTWHQFRHTLGTEMVNEGVDLYIIQRLLDHDSADMTQHYARVHDTTLRREFDAYQERVRINGDVVTAGSDEQMSQAEWVKERLGRKKLALPNGFCGRPLQQSCPHPNACLTCPDFLTTVEFLPLHQRQLKETEALITSSTEAGRDRVAESNREVRRNLVTIISSLESLRDSARRQQ